MISLVQVDARAIATATGFDIDKPVYGLAGVEGGEVLGVGGLAWGGGRCWVFFTMLTASERRYGFAVRRGLKRLLRTARQLGETEVYVIRDTDFASSAKLLPLMGFSFLNVEDGKEVWRYVWH